MVVIATQLGVGMILRQHRERKQVTARPINPSRLPTISSPPCLGTTISFSAMPLEF